ncbi:MAG TPA: helix-turn-helix domain-containing protein [Verrucomicrobiales bacterium]|nr:helix-turn-helix domain-containing protein [Verrucomicrobiales bacterium]
MSSIGQQLSHARQARGLTIEDVAFHTRIAAGRLRDLENDDLSRFANLTYARGFLKIYSGFLDLDISEYLNQFSSAEFATASGHEYIQTANATHNLPPGVITDYGRARHTGLYILVVTLLAGGGIVWWNNRGGSPEESVSTGSPAPATTGTKPAPAPAPVPKPVTPSPIVASEKPSEPVVPPKAEVVEEVEENKNP